MEPPESRTRSTPRPERAALEVHRLVVVASPDAGVVGRPVVLESPLLLGRAGGPAGLALADPEISRRHARLEPRGGGWWLVDQDSRNGAFVDGARVAQAPLAPEAVIRVGGSLLLYQHLTLAADDRLAPERAPLYGTSLAMQRLRASLQQVAPAAVPVLIAGESGAGKELIARQLHALSGRAGPFVPVNCGALPEALAESELFGSLRGAFTGASADRPGLFAAAHGGTLFLDEIGELPLSIQPRLLRALAEGEVRPVGGAAPRAVDVRVIAASWKALPEEVAAGRFRGDLYARLAGWTLRAPPLAQRREDILPLARRAVPGCAFSADAAEALLLAAWPYNVRQLQQEVKAAAIRAAAPEIGLAHLAAALRGPLEGRAAQPEASPPIPLALRVPRERAPDAEGLAEAMAHFEGNVARVAEYFGRERRQIYRWLAGFGLDPEGFRR